MKLKERIKSRPGTFIIYGEPGVGKTELCANFHKPVFLIDPQEDGICDLQDNGFVDASIPVYEVNSWRATLSALDELVKSDRRTVVVETLGGIEAVLHNFAFEDLKYESWKKFESFAEGSRSTGRWVRDFIEKLITLRNSGKTIVISAHASVRHISNPIGADHDIIVPDCCKTTWTFMSKWAQNVFYFALDKSTKKDSANIIEKAKGVSCGDRVLFTSPHAAYQAKNRFRLPEQIAMGSNGEEGYKALTSAIKESLSCNTN